MIFTTPMERDWSIDLPPEGVAAMLHPDYIDLPESDFWENFMQSVWYAPVGEHLGVRWRYNIVCAEAAKLWIPEDWAERNQIDLSNKYTSSSDGVFHWLSIKIGDGEMVLLCWMVRQVSFRYSGMATDNAVVAKFMLLVDELNREIESQAIKSGALR